MKSLLATSQNLDDKLSFRYSVGCHAFVMGISNRYVHMAIPKEIVDKRLKYWKISLDNLLSLYETMGFKIIYTESKEKMTFTKKEYSEWVIFILDSNTFDSNIFNDIARRKARYFAFCMLRHFYYRSGLIKYFLLLNKDNKERDENVEINNWFQAKRKFLSDFYTYIDRYRSDIDYKHNLIISSHISSDAYPNMRYPYIYGQTYNESFLTLDTANTIFLYDRKTLKLEIISKEKFDSLKTIPVEDTLIKVVGMYGTIFVLPKKIKIFEIKI